MSSDTQTSSQVDIPEVESDEEQSSDVPEPSDDESQQVSQAVSSVSGASDGHKVIGISGHGIDNGTMYFTVDWDGADSQGQPWPSEDLPFHSIQDPSLLFGTYEGWPTFPQTDDLRDSLDAQAGNPYWPYLQEGYLALLDHVAEGAIKHTSLRDVYKTKDAFTRMAFQMLISVPLPVLNGICGAGLLARKAVDEDVFAWLTNNLRKSRRRPSTYMIELSDELGQPMTFEHARRLLKFVRAYANPTCSADRDVAVRVEKETHKVLTASDIAEIRNDQVMRRTWLRGDKAQRRLNNLLDNFQNEINTLLSSDPDEKRRMPYTMREIGYSNRGVQRLNEHLDHTINGNHAMVLFGIAAKVLKMPYALYAEYIFLGFREEHAVASEILFSILAQSYSTTGKGFNTVEAGRSNASNKKYKDSDWNRWQADVLDETPAKDNAALEQKRIDEIEQEIADSKRLVAEEQLFALRCVRRALVNVSRIGDIEDII